LGSSTAVFGALGILTACQTLDVARSTRAVRLWEIILPAGAGIALLAYLGTGDEHTDVTAHLFGFLAGGCFGALSTFADLKKRLR
jgi:membrane associated rhomboid family serine protease